MHGNEQLFAPKYKLDLPTEEELKAEIDTQKAMFYLRQQSGKEVSIVDWEYGAKNDLRKWTDDI